MLDAVVKNVNKMGFFCEAGPLDIFVSNYVRSSARARYATGAADAAAAGWGDPDGGRAAPLRTCSVRERGLLRGAAPAAAGRRPRGMDASARDGPSTAATPFPRAPGPAPPRAAGRPVADARRPPAPADDPGGLRVQLGGGGGGLLQVQLGRRAWRPPRACTRDEGAMAPRELTSPRPRRRFRSRSSSGTRRSACASSASGSTRRNWCANPAARLRGGTDRS